MDKTTYLAAWIDGSISDSELEKMEGKAALDRYKKIKTLSSKLEIQAVENLKWEVFSKQLTAKTPLKKSRNWIFSMAASMAVLIGLGSFLLSQKEYLATNTYTPIELADGSLVKLAPGASLQHRRSFNLVNRKLRLKGEAFFKVEKGTPFVVTTPNGTVEVLGTAFKIISTPGFFKVICTEGRVKVTQQGQSYFLTKGLAFDNTNRNVEKVDLSQYQSDLANYYSSVPLDYVVQLVSTLYNIKIYVNSNKSNYFTGTIPLDNQEKALNSISLPFSFQVIKQADKEYLLIEK